MDRNEMIIEALRQEIAEKAAENAVRVANLRAEITEQGTRIAELESQIAQYDAVNEEPPSDAIEGKVMVN